MAAVASRRRTVKLRLYAGIVGGLLFGAVAAGRPELVALVTPFGVALVLGLALGLTPGVSARLVVERVRLLEGEGVEVTVEVSSTEDIARLELALGLTSRLVAADGRVVRALPVLAETPAIARFTIDATRWGAHRVGPVAFRAQDIGGFHAFEGLAGHRQVVRVYPRPETLTALVSPMDTRAVAGNRRARAKGEGIEFADLRPFVPGDRVRAVNWRIAARGGGLWVTQRHPEHNSDVVVFLDSFSETVLGPSVRAAASLLAAYAPQRDRIGLISFGGSLRWVQPGMGLGQLYRITEALIDTEAVVGYAWLGIDIVPARTLPPKALVIALSPLEDERTLAALANLRGRGIDLAIIEVTPTAFVEPPESELDKLAYRIWLLDRESRRIQFRRIGVPVVEWSEQVPMAAVLEEVNAFRHRDRRRAG